MIRLIMKDILIQKKSIITSVIFATIMISSFQSSQGNGAYVLAAMGVIFLLLAGAFALDEKNRSDILMNSLPINRKNIVTARYLSLLVFTLMATLLVSLIGALMQIGGILRNINFISILDIAAIFFVSIIMFSIYIPIYFKFGYIKSRAINMLLYIAIFVVAGFAQGIRVVISQNRGGQFIRTILSLSNNMPEWLTGPIFLVFIIIVLSISFSISIRVYHKREF